MRDPEPLTSFKERSSLALVKGLANAVAALTRTPMKTRVQTTRTAAFAAMAIVMCAGLMAQAQVVQRMRPGLPRWGVCALTIVATLILQLVVALRVRKLALWVMRRPTAGTASPSALTPGSGMPG